jgi:hypothetical protein
MMHSDPGSALVTEMLTWSEPMATKIHNMLHPMTVNANKTSGALRDNGFVIETPACSSPPLVATVDGARITEPLYAVDLLAAAAVAAYGKHVTPAAAGTVLPRFAWVDAAPTAVGNDAAAQAVMFMLELAVLQDTVSDYIFQDGSRGSILLSFIKTLGSSDQGLREIVYREAGKYNLPELIAHAFNPDRGDVFALPKSDTTDHFAKIFRKLNILPESMSTLSDKVLATQVLHEGEMFTPRTMTEYRKLTFAPPTNDPTVTEIEMVNACNEALKPFITAAGDGRLLSFYLKPVNSFSVIKVEITKPPAMTDVEAASLAAGVVASDVPAPTLMEPFSQHIVDMYAKTISSGMVAFQQALIGELPPESRGYIDLITSSYRTT